MHVVPSIRPAAVDRGHPLIGFGQRQRPGVPALDGGICICGDQRWNIANRPRPQRQLVDVQDRLGTPPRLLGTTTGGTVFGTKSRMSPGPPQAVPQADPPLWIDLVSSGFRSFLNGRVTSLCGRHLITPPSPSLLAAVACTAPGGERSPEVRGSGVAKSGRWASGLSPCETGPTYSGRCGSSPTHGRRSCSRTSWPPSATT